MKKILKGLGVYQKMLDKQQFYITKMMMLTFSIIVMCSYVYSAVLFPEFLKNTHFKEHDSVVAFKYSICDTENNT